MLDKKKIPIIREESLRFIASLWDGITQAFADIIIVIIIIAVIAVCMISKHCDEDWEVLGFSRIARRK